MQLRFIASALRSRATRQKIGNNGKRTIRRTTPDETRDDNGNILSSIYNSLSGLGNWISEKIGQFLRKINFQKIWDWIVTGFHTIWTFNWQATDEEIDKQIAAQWQNVSVRMAGVAGRAFGYLVCGFVPGVSMMVINEALAASVLKKVGEEAIQDLTVEISMLLGMIARVTLNHATLSIFKNVRKLIKKAAKNPTLRNVISSFINPTIIDRWGEEKGKEWSFASAFNKLKDKLPEPWKDRVEEFVDEFSDACIEAGFVVASGIDEFYGLNHLAYDDFNSLGREKTVYFYPNRDVESESFLLHGKEEILKGQMLDILNSQQLLDNREIALSLPTEEWGRVPVIESSSIDVEFEFYKFEEPPYWTKERRNDNGRQRIKLNNVKRTKLSFQEIKTAFGTGFMSGTIRTVVTWQSGRITKFWCSSENEGENVAKALDSLCDDNIVFPLLFEARKGAPPSISAQKYNKNYRQYLAQIKIWNWDKINKFERTVGKVEKTDRKRLIKSLKMHYKEEPSWWQREMEEILKNTL